MKKLVSLLLALCLLLGLTGCGAAKEVLDEVITEVTKDTLHQKSGFSITLPAYAVDTSKESSAVKEPYLFVVGDIFLCAMELYKEEIGYDMTAEEYAQLLVDTNNYPGGVSVKDGLPTFTFTSEEDGLRYLCVTAVTDNSFWFINASCDIENFEKNRDTMWTYLCSAQVSATGDAFVPAPTTTTVTIQDLSIQLPAAGYTDLTSSTDTDMDFVYMLTDKTVIMGMREEKAALAEELQSLDAYVPALIDSNGLSCTIEYRNSIPTFLYTSDDGEFTYLATVLEGTDSFWHLQGYSFTEDFANVEAELWQYLSSAQVA